MPVTRECKHCGAVLGSMRPFCGWERILALSRRCLRSLATCQIKESTADAIKARLCREKTKWRCCQFVKFRSPPISNSIPRFCLLSAFEHILRTLPKESRRSINISHQSRKRNFGRQSRSSTSSSCVRKARKEGKNASRGTSRASFLKGQLHHRGTG